MERTGIYKLKAASTEKLLAVNLCDSDESSIEPKDSLTLSGQEVKAADAAIRRFNLPLWPYLAGFVLFLLCAEWLIYNSKSRDILSSDVDSAAIIAAISG